MVRKAESMSPKNWHEHNESIRAVVEFRARNDAAQGKAEGWKANAEVIRLGSQVEAMRIRIENLQESLQVCCLAVI